MRRIEILPLAQHAVDDVAAFVEDHNTKGSGLRWLLELYDFMEESANNSAMHWPLCNNVHLASLNFSCLSYKDVWVIVFRYNDEELVVHRFVLGKHIH